MIELSKIYNEDCLETMKRMDVDSIDSIITDPPYGISFMGRDWDHGVPGVHFWTEALRVAKPGAFLLAFGGTRTFHRLTCAIEDAGWEIRDCIGWLYGSGFPKSKDISKAIDEAKGADREIVGKSDRGSGAQPSKLVNHGEGDTGIGYMDGTGKTFDVTVPATDLAKLWNGWGTSLKPAWEPIIVAMKLCDGTFAQNAQKYGVAGLNIDGCRVGIEANDDIYAKNPHTIGTIGASGIYGEGKPTLYKAPQGRWPANIIHDGSEEVLAVFPDSKSTGGSGPASKNWRGPKGRFMANIASATGGFGDSGSASRFFYCAKASRSEREMGLEGMDEKRVSFMNTHGGNPEKGEEWQPIDDRTGKSRNRFAATVRNPHPTVKPLALMVYLCKLTQTPTGGIVYDPFAGSGTTLLAAKALGRPWVGSEVEKEYCEIAVRRLATINPLFS